MPAALRKLPRTEHCTLVCTPDFKCVVCVNNTASNQGGIDNSFRAQWGIAGCENERECMHTNGEQAVVFFGWGALVAPRRFESQACVFVVSYWYCDSRAVEDLL